MVKKVNIGKGPKPAKGRRGLGGANWGIVGDALNATVGNMLRVGRFLDDLNPEHKKKNKERDDRMKKKGEYIGPGGKRRSAPTKTKPVTTKPVKKKPYYLYIGKK